MNAVNAQSLTLPSGDAKMGDQQFIVARQRQRADASHALNQLPIKQVGADHGPALATSRMSATAGRCSRTSCAPRAQRSVLLTIIKNGDASTLDVVNRVKAALPDIQKAAPPGMHIQLLFDQSVFVQQAIDSVLREGAIAAGLTALMILLFLGSWRSTLVVMVSIPLSILTSIAVLSALGQTHQHHDAGRAGAGRRHPGRRFDGHDREHAPAVRGGRRASTRRCSRAPPASPCRR